MIEVLVGLGIIVVVVWLIIGLVVLFTSNSSYDPGWWALLLFAPWIVGVLSLIGLLAYNLGNDILH